MILEDQQPVQELRREVNAIGEKYPKEEYKLSEEEMVQANKDALREWEIRIQFLNRGCVVHVGCKAIAFEDVKKAMEEINKYVASPYKSQKEWRKVL